MPSENETLENLLYRLEAELSRLNLWSDTPPDPEALSSEQPFCYDTMRFESWLQWVFIPQIRQILLANAPLPGACSITPMAEMAFQGTTLDLKQLLAILDAIDRSITSADSLML